MRLSVPDLASTAAGPACLTFDRVHGDGEFLGQENAASSIDLMAAIAWSQQGVLDRFDDEPAVAAEAPMSASDEEIEELGRAVGPQNIGRFGEADSRSSVATVHQVARVVLHPGVPVGVEFGAQRGGSRVTIGRVAQQEQQRSDPGCDLGGEPAPALDDLARVGLARL